MIITKKSSSGGVGFARKAPYEYDGNKYEADLQTGDTVKILNSGITEEGKWGDQLNFKIETRNGEKKQSFNQATLNVLHDEFGEESEDWIGKEVKVILHKTVIVGEKRIVAYFVTGEWSLDEYGELSKSAEVKDMGDIIKDSDIPF